MHVGKRNVENSRVIPLKFHETRLIVSEWFGGTRLTGFDFILLGPIEECSVLLGCRDTIPFHLSGVSGFCSTYFDVHITPQSDKVVSYSTRASKIDALLLFT